jgi:phage terminase Nu1 subunit (DNA packaging protein)
MNPAKPPLRWTLGQASREFCTSEAQVRRQLARAGAIVGVDGCYSTMQVVEALYTGAAERARLSRAQAERLELRCAVERGEWISVSDMIESVKDVFMLVRQTILDSGLPIATQDELLTNLQKLADVPEQLVQKRWPMHTVNGHAVALGGLNDEQITALGFEGAASLPPAEAHRPKPKAKTK